MTLDSEGRCVIIEFPAFVLIGMYSPANTAESRTEFRLGYLQLLDIRVRNLVAMGKEVILTGDLNVIRSARDVANLADNLKKDGISVEEFMSAPARRLFNQFVFGGEVRGAREDDLRDPVMWDLCREFHPDREGMFTHWDTKKNLRPANNGTRIDYVLCTSGIKDWFCDANIQEGLMGSDHCPVFGVLKDKVNFYGDDVALWDVMNPKGVFENGERKREWSQKDMLPLSARLIPEFDRRRSIRDMFMKKASKSKAETQPQAREEKTSALDYSDKAAPNTAAPNPGVSQTMPSTPRKDKTPTKNSDASIVTYKTPTKSPTKKRAVPVSPSSNPQPKRSRLSLDSKTTNKSKIDPSQRTIKGFFKPTAVAEQKQPAGSSVIAEEQVTTPTRSETSAPVPAAQALQQNTASFETPNPAPTETVQTSPEKLFDSVQAKEDWSKLLGKRVPPRCEHKEPCISLVTKKPGVNCGKYLPSIVPEKRPSVPWELTNANVSWTRPLLLHLPSTAGSFRRKRTCHGMAVPNIYME